MVTGEHHIAWMPTVAMHVTSLRGTVHLVSDAAIATSGAGRYAAMCGQIFTPAAMTAPDGARDCQLCIAIDRTAQEALTR